MLADSRFRENRMDDSSVEAIRELCDDLDGLIGIAKQGRTPIRAVSLIERTRADLEAYLDRIHAAALSAACAGMLPTATTASADRRR